MISYRSVQVELLSILLNFLDKKLNVLIFRLDFTCKNRVLTFVSMFLISKII